jgi:transposase
VTRLLKQHRIRRLDAEAAIGILRQPVVKVAAGVTEAAVLCLRSLIARLRLANRELHQAARKLDELRAALSQAAAANEGGSRDAAILASLPKIGTGTLATLLAEASGPLGRRDYAALRTLSGVAPVTKRSGKSHLVVMRHAAHARLRQAVPHWARVAVCRTTPKAAAATTPCAGAGTPTVVRSAASPTGCLGSPASCCSGRRRSIPSTLPCQRPQHRHRSWPIVARALKTAPSISPAKPVLQPLRLPLRRLDRG